MAILTMADTKITEIKVIDKKEAKPDSGLQYGKPLPMAIQKWGQVWTLAR